MKDKKIKTLARDLALQTGQSYRAARTLVLARGHFLAWIYDVTRVAAAHSASVTLGRDVLQAADDGLWRKPPNEIRGYTMRTMRAADAAAEPERRLVVNAILREPEEHIIGLAALSFMGSPRPTTVLDIVREWHDAARRLATAGRRAFAEELAAPSLSWSLPQGVRVVELLDVDPAKLSERVRWERLDVRTKPGGSALDLVAQVRAVADAP